MGRADAAALDRYQAAQVPQGLAYGARVLREALDILEGQVDDVVGARAAVEVATGQPLQPALVVDAVLAVGQVRAEGDATSQGAALHAGRSARAQLC